MKLSLSLVAVLSCVAVFSVAGVVSAADISKDDMADRMRLSKDLHDIRNIRERINLTIEGVAKVMPQEDRGDFEEYVRGHVSYDELEEKSIRYAAEIYTVPELKAMIAYFGSADGQSAEEKSDQFAAKIGKDISTQIDAAILAAKYDGVSPQSIPKKIGQEKSSGASGVPVSPALLDAPQK